MFVTVLFFKRLLLTPTVHVSREEKKHPKWRMHASNFPSVTVPFLFTSNVLQVIQKQHKKVLWQNSLHPSITWIKYTYYAAEQVSITPHGARLKPQHACFFLKPHIHLFWDHEQLVLSVEPLSS